jgi:hypothetical protein
VHLSFDPLQELPQLGLQTLIAAAPRSAGGTQLIAHCPRDVRQLVIPLLEELYLSTRLRTRIAG